MGGRSRSASGVAAASCFNDSASLHQPQSLVLQRYRRLSTEITLDVFAQGLGYISFTMEHEDTLRRPAKAGQAVHQLIAVGMGREMGNSAISAFTGNHLLYSCIHLTKIVYSNKKGIQTWRLRVRHGSPARMC